MGCRYCIKVYRCDVVEEAPLMQNTTSSMSVEAPSYRTEYEPNGVARDQASETVSGDGEACHFLPVVLQTLHGGEYLGSGVRFSHPVDCT